MPICHNKSYEREFVNLMNEKGHYSTRIAGSGSGKDAVCDCVTFMNKVPCFVEVKSTKDAVFYVRSHIRQQLEIMSQKALEVGARPVLALKFKHKGWNFHDLSGGVLSKFEFEMNNELR